MHCTRLVPIAAVLALVGSATADTVRFYDTGDGTTSGGSFDAVTGLRGTFETYCLERDENISYGALYYYTVSDEAMAGGSGGVSPDPISDITRNIYYAFRTSQLNITGTATEIADAVQNAIWFEEEEINSVSGKALSLHSFFSQESNYVDGYQMVHVMNVWANSDNTGNRQDMLIVVPLPTGTGLACVGLFGLAAVRRRRV